MSAQVLFHPQLTLMEAARVANEQGGRLVWRNGRIRLLNAMRRVDLAAEAAEAADYLSALEHLRAARGEIERNVPEVAPCAA